MPRSDEAPERHVTRRQFLAITSGAVAGAALSNPVIRAAAASSVQGAPSASLLQSFADPPLRARPRAYWVWSNGVFDPNQLTRELEDVKAKGLGGLDIFDIGVPDERNVIPAGPAFMSPEAVEGYAHAIREATRLDLEIGFITSSSWNAGGPWVTPEMASKTLYGTETPVSGPGRVDVSLPYPDVPEPKFEGREGGPDPWSGVEIYSRQIAVLALPTNEDRVIPAFSDIVDLTDRVEKTAAGNDAQLAWDAPEGDWTVLRIVSTNNRERLVLPSPNSDGYMIDHLSAEATEAHLRVIIEGLLGGLETFEDTALGYLYLPSYEVRGLREWTPSFSEEFRRRRGYDVRPFLPALFDWTVVSTEVSERFHFDRRLTVSDLLVQNHYRTATEVCREHGLGLHAESGGPGQPIHDFPAEALSALNAVGVPRGEFWVRSPPDVDDDANVIKAVASAIHIYGEQVGEMESFTSFDHWDKGPFDLKPYADRVLAQGANRFVFHTMPHNPPEAGTPGWAYHAGTHVGPNRVWWPMVDPFISYLARSCYLLQEGRYVADVCFYYGHDAPKTIDEEPFDPNADALGFGFKYDYVNTDVMLNHTSVEDGRIALTSGMRYHVFVLPDREDMPLDVLEKVEELVETGATVVGPKPLRTPGLYDPAEPIHRQRDAQLQELADRLWGNMDGRQVTERSYGDGRIVWGVPVRDVLEGMRLVPDFDFEGGDDTTELDFIHRRVDGREIYFVVNLQDRWEQVDGLLRARGKVPQIWDPVSGESNPHPLYESFGDRTRVGLELAPFGSAFVVLEEGDPHAHLVSLTANGEVLFPALVDRPSRSRPVDLHVDEEGGLVLTAWEPGAYAFQPAGGERRQLDVAGPADQSAGGERRPIDVAGQAGTRQLDGPWEVRFPDGLGAPRDVTFDDLISWTEHPHEGVRHFSGVAAYERSFQIGQDLIDGRTSIRLDLGMVRHAAEVFVNDTPVGIVWKAPFEVDVTEAVEVGENRLRVEVANVWANRLLGDRGTPQNERFTSTNVAESRQTDELVPSGLLGPVHLRFGVRNVL